MKKRTQAERDALALWFADEPAVLAAARAAALAQGKPELTQPVAYCLVVLAVKDDGIRTLADGTRGRPYRLDPGSAELPERLAHHAGNMAANLARCAATYETILDELNDRRVTTLSRMMPVPARDHDVRDVIAERLAGKLALGPRVSRMTLARAREGGIPPGQYAFQSPLRRWVRTATRNAWPRPPVLTARRPELLEGDELIAHEEALGDQLLRDTAELIARTREARGLIDETIDRTLSASSDIREQLPPHVAPELWAQIRSQFVGVLDELVAERRALDGMLAFLALAMRHAGAQQCVAAAGLRLEKNDPAAVAELTARMRAMLEDDRHPTPMLVAQTRAASFTGVGSRRAALKELRSAAPAARAAALAPVGAMLDALPESVSDLHAIAAAATAATRQPSEPPIRYGTVRTYRGTILAELSAVDVRYEAVYARYASTRRRP